MIPKIIHYCWLSSDSIPEQSQKCIESWHRKLSDYEFILWNFERFEKDKSAWVSEAFAHKKYACAADYIRLYAIYHYGGIYMDMDVEVIKAFDDLLDKPYMLAYEDSSHSGIEAGCFGAEKNNPFIYACFKTYENQHFVKPDGSLTNKVLPIVMKEQYEKGNYNYQLYSQDYFTAKSWETGKIKQTKNTYAIHHFAGSWLSSREQTIIKEGRKWGKIFGFRIGKNIAEYHYEFKCNGFSGMIRLTKEKIMRKL